MQQQGERERESRSKSLCPSQSEWRLWVKYLAHLEDEDDQPEGWPGGAPNWPHKSRLWAPLSMPDNRSDSVWLPRVLQREFLSRAIPQFS